MFYFQQWQQGLCPTEEKNPQFKMDGDPRQYGGGKGFRKCILYITNIVNLGGVDHLSVFNFQVSAHSSSNVYSYKSDSTFKCVHSSSNACSGHVMFWAFPTCNFIGIFCLRVLYYGIFCRRHFGLVNAPHCHIVNASHVID